MKPCSFLPFIYLNHYYIHYVFLLTINTIKKKLISKASPPRFVNFDQLMAAADGMKNMTLAHEIAVNNDFELEQGSAPTNR